MLTTEYPFLKVVNPSPKDSKRLIFPNSYRKSARKPEIAKIQL